MLSIARRRLLTCLFQRRIYADVFAKWPKQDLRPDYQLQDVLRTAVEERFKNAKPTLEAEEALKARALQFLLQDKFKERVRCSLYADENAECCSSCLVCLFVC